MTLKILVTNDDGIHAVGIQALISELRKVGEVTTIAPDRERSAVGHSFSMHHPIRARQVSPSSIATDGTPTDCVMFGILGYLKEKPDIVVSGINHGPNLGDDVTYSGTVAAALEATMLGVPAFAISLNLASYAPDAHSPNFNTAAEFAAELTLKVIKEGMEPNTFLNVNVPDLPREEIKGTLITNLGQRVYRDQVIKRLDPQGREYYWIGGERPTWIQEGGTDFDAMENDAVSITPLRFQLTANDSIDLLKKWDWDFTNKS